MSILSFNHFCFRLINEELNSFFLKLLLKMNRSNISLWIFIIVVLIFDPCQMNLFRNKIFIRHFYQPFLRSKWLFFSLINKSQFIISKWILMTKWFNFLTIFLPWLFLFSWSSFIFYWILYNILSCNSLMKQKPPHSCWWNTSGILYDYVYLSNDLVL